MSDPIVRPMTVTDIPVVAAWMPALPLWQRYGVTVESATRMFERAIAQDDIVLTADIPDEATACGLLRCLRRGAFGLSPYVSTLGVQAGYQNRRIGAALLNEAERVASEASADLFLLASDFNTDAQRFYRRQGYTQIGAIADYVVPGVTELIFRKRLSVRG
jgi:ribosomal protein S18 acetylase RimI-like enzyme